MLAFGLLDLFWSMLWFFLFISWIMLLTRVFADIFRSTDLSGIATVFWVVFVIVFPLIGVLVYIVVRGDTMTEHEVALMKGRDEAMRSYLQQAVGSPSSADELTKLVQLRDAGVLSAEEFAAAKAKALS